jgi:hypothetical protein
VRSIAKVTGAFEPLGANFLLPIADKPVDVVAVIALDISVLTPEKASPAGLREPSSTALRHQVRDSLAVHLVNRAPKEHLDFREPIIRGRSANIGL